MVPAVCFFLARSACSGVTREIIGGGEGREHIVLLRSSCSLCDINILNRLNDIC